MKQRIKLWWSELTLRMLAKRHKLTDCPDGDLVVCAIRLRQEMEKAQASRKERLSPNR